MNKYWYKVFGLTIISVLILAALPLQSAQAAGEPLAPSQLEALPSFPGDLAITLSWSDNSFDETGFEIERCAGLGCSDFSLIGTRDSSIYGAWWNDIGLSENTTYSYRVRAVNGFGASAYSNIASASTSYAQPNGQATSLSGTFTNNGVELTWTENATIETRYEIERYEVGAGGTEFIVIGAVAPDTTSYLDSTALKGTSYDYRVVSWRFDIFGGAPFVVNVLTGTGITAPTNVDAKAGSSSSIRLTWKGKFNSDTQVAIQRENCDIYNGCFGWITVGQVNVSTGRFTDTGLISATSYNYRIRSVSATSVSLFTDTVTAITRR